MSELKSRALLSKEYLLLLGTSLLGFVEATPWVVVSLTVLLTLWSTVSDPDFFWRFRRIGKLHVLGRFWLVSLAENLLFVGAAFLLGIGLGELSGLR